MMNVISASSITGSALDAEKMRVDIVSQNIANANTTKGIDGKPYQRRIVAFESLLDAAAGPNMQGVRLSEIKRDETPGEIINNPQHPHADDDGNVTMPNVNIPFEMVDMVTATRSYEANLAVVRNARQLATQALSIGR
jgi:flagellar basal-body rod protein FlgC